MDRKRLTLDNPAFISTLRYGHRSVAYERRPLQAQTMSDVQRVAGVRSAPVVTKLPQPPAEKLLSHVPQYKPDVVAPKPVQLAELEVPQFLPDVAPPPHQAEAREIPQAIPKAVVKTPLSTSAVQYVSDILPPKPKAKTILPNPEAFQTLQDIIAPKSRVAANQVAVPKVPKEIPTPEGPQPSHVSTADSSPEVPSTQPQKRRSLKPTKQGVLYAMAGIVFAVGLLVSLNGLRTNKQVAAQVKKSQTVSDTTADASTTAPSTIKPTAAQITNYAVSPNVPRYIDIPKLKVHARTLSEGIDKKGALQVPWNIYDTGWYNASSQPGQNGAALIDGHSGIGGMHGVFYQLASLSAGDQIVVTRGDGQKFTYVVSKVQTVNVQAVDMGSMLVSADTNKPGLNLITCTGDQIPGTDQLNKRVLVYAVMQ